MVTNSLQGLLGIVVVIAVVGTITGVALSGTDALNFNTSAAEAHIREMEAEVEAEKNKIDLKYYEAIQSARTEVEKEQLRIELEQKKEESENELRHQVKRQEVELALTRTTRYVMLAVVAMGAMIVSSGMTVLMVQYGRSQLLLAKAEATKAEMQRTAERRAEQIRQARAREIAERKAALERQSATKLVPGGNGNRPSKSEDIEFNG